MHDTTFIIKFYVINRGALILNVYPLQFIKFLELWVNLILGKPT